MQSGGAAASAAAQERRDPERDAASAERNARLACAEHTRLFYIVAVNYATAARAARADAVAAAPPKAV